MSSTFSLDVNVGIAIACQTVCWFILYEVRHPHCIYYFRLFPVVGSEHSLILSEPNLVQLEADQHVFQRIGWFVCLVCTRAGMSFHTPNQRYYHKETLSGLNQKKPTAHRDITTSSSKVQGSTPMSEAVLEQGFHIPIMQLHDMCLIWLSVALVTSVG